MAVKFMTIKGASTIATKPFYIGIPHPIPHTKEHCSKCIFMHYNA